LLNGKIGRYFTGMAHLIDTLREVFLKPNPINTYNDIPWNDIFINMSYVLMNINTVCFVHKKNNDVQLFLPSYITNKTHFLLPHFKNIIIFKKQSKYYPIYQINIDVFFKVKMITNKFFEYNSSIMNTIGKLIEIHFNENAKKQITNDVDLSVIMEFINDKSKYTIKKLFVDKTNKCYYANLFNTFKKKNIYIPIKSSYYIKKKSFDISYDMFSRMSHKTPISLLQIFMEDFNYWIATKSKDAGLLDNSLNTSMPLEKRVHPIYPYIIIDKWLVLSQFNKKISASSKVIGFTSSNVHYYFNQIDVSTATNIKPVKMIQLYYDPDVINKQIFMNMSYIADTRYNNIGQSIYNTNLYYLILLEFMSFFNKQRNNTLRNDIKQVLLGDFNKQFDTLMETISNMVNNDDYKKIKTQIYDYINTHHNKKTLICEIDDTFYDFDHKMIEQIKILPHNKIVIELEKISKQFISYGDIKKIKNLNFPNMFISCQSKTSQDYCKKNKFIISRKKLLPILDIIASDIVNPIKNKWLFSSIFSDNTISYFKFIRRPDEHINIHVVH
jgi:hypothetical protein